MKKNKCGGKTVKVRVTKDHILDGEFGSADYCPLALAFNAAGFTASVEADEIVLTTANDQEFRIATPAKLATFINKFDAIEDLDIRERADENEYDFEDRIKEVQNQARKRLKGFKFDLVLPGPATIKV